MKYSLAINTIYLNDNALHLFYGREGAVESLQEGASGFIFPVIGEDFLKVSLDLACALKHLRKLQNGMLFRPPPHLAIPGP
jgi:hypothetical protein